MAERRPLVAGIKPDPAVEQQFVRSGKPPPAAAAEPEPVPRAPKAGASPVARAPLTTRIRGDYAAALKRASLERQLSGTTPFTLQDILEAALEPWLRENGYLSRPAD